MLDDLAQVLDRLSGVDPAALADAEAVLALHRSLARLEAVTTRATAAFDAGGSWEADGARSASAWLSVRASIPRAVAHRRVRVGRGLRHLPLTEGAWLAGEVTESAVASLVAARTPAIEAAMARDEAMLVDQAQRLRPDQFGRVLAYWCHRADPAGCEDRAERVHDGRRFHLSVGFEGCWVGELVLDPVGGEVVANQLRIVEAELFAADWAEARARVGEGAVATDLARTPAQRRADALVELATRAGTAPVGGRRPEPLLTVLVGWESLAGPVCELAGGGAVLTPGTLARSSTGPGWSGWSSTAPPGSSTWG